MVICDFHVSNLSVNKINLSKFIGEILVNLFWDLFYLIQCQGKEKRYNMKILVSDTQKKTHKKNPGQWKLIGTKLMYSVKCSLSP